ncbi:MAG: hypothetical protein E7455_04395 [Ruminococcaceae bacterium]|nr:hypothetical protein [Oscillospiraceae bacterium]
MKIECVWEHNGNDTLLYAANLPGVYARGSNLEIAMEKLLPDVCSYLAWAGLPSPGNMSFEVVQDAVCDLNIADADSDVLFHSERIPLTFDEYMNLKGLALKSAKDFHTLYSTIPDVDTSDLPIRSTFYGQVPRTAREMYNHTKNVNAYYFAEIGIDADNEGTISECRQRGFEKLEGRSDFLSNSVHDGSYGELWTLRKVLRRFLWHDRIHAKAMYRMAVRVFGSDAVPNIFCFE